MATTGHGLVYPDSTGNVNLWEHIQNLAESTETALDANELDGGWVAIGGGIVTGTLRYRAYRGIVFIQANASATFADGVTVTLNPSNALPAEVRPSVGVRTGGYFGGYPGTMTIDTAGVLTAIQQSGASRANIAAHITYPLG